MNVHLFSFLVLVLLSTPKGTANANGNAHTEKHHHVKATGGIIGAIVDNSSRVGKEEQVAMEMAIKDFNDYSNQSIVLHIRNSPREPFMAAFAAMDLINKQHVQAILGPQTWEEVSVVAQVSNEKNIPVLSFADSTPEWATERWPFLAAASPNLSAQMKAIAEIVQSWEWNQVTVIYEDIDSSATAVIPHLSDALREKGAEIVHFLALPPFDSSTLFKELWRLQRGQCRVFVVHLSIPMALSLFEKAKKLKMMGKGYVWITTDVFTSLFHSIDASTIPSMQGILGVKRYFPENGSHFKDFNKRFRRRFSLKHPEEDYRGPGIYALQAYDAVWTVCTAMNESKNWSQDLLENIWLTDFNGLTGKVQFVNQRTVPVHNFQIVNVRGRSYIELGFWSDGLGFSETIDDSASYNHSMEGLGQVFWPGGLRHIPRGWSRPTSAKPLKIGVPRRSLFKQYVNVEYDHLKNETSFSGIAIGLFEAIVKELPFHLQYKFCPFNDTYDLLVEQIHYKKFDAVVGDVAITAMRSQYAEFTPPYTESGLVMVVPLQSKSRNKEWLFIKPFTKDLWIIIATITIYNGFVVWLIERNHCSEPTGSALNQTGTLICSSFTTLLSVQGNRLHSSLSRITMVVWLFVALVTMQTYTASLTSILAEQRVEPTVSSIESLQKSNAMVGCSNASFVSKYLVDVLHFIPTNIKGYNSPDDYARDLRNGEIAAIFLQAAVAKLFLARYCKGFTPAGPVYDVGGHGFVILLHFCLSSFSILSVIKGVHLRLKAFPIGSPLLPSISKALLKVSETGKLREIENSVLASQQCVEVELDDEISRLSARSFFVLFLLTGATSTTALIIYVIYNKYWKVCQVLVEHWRHHRRVRSMENRKEMDSGNIQVSAI